ncbi:hypothetical protein MSG28_015468 [Choristoneura fumiferana]|uniref:Uncharacterized protein n=1 Tax=Choristoneura fumiferana TaxID=7141 RepID=A0ACC0KB52_CHOFU|nr:hypothetical protein MSG28_015468 [Choristoneura fumiferana]
MSGDGDGRLLLVGDRAGRVDVRCPARCCERYPAAISAVASGAIDLKKFITHHMPLARTQEALRLAQSGDAMKVIIHLPE